MDRPCHAGTYPGVMTSQAVGRDHSAGILTDPPFRSKRCSPLRRHCGVDLAPIPVLGFLRVNTYDVDM